MKATISLHLQHNVGQIDRRIFGGFLEHLGIDAAADGDRAEDVAVLAHDHLRPLLAGRGAARVHERGHRHLARGALQLVEVLEEFGHAVILQCQLPGEVPEGSQVVRGRELVDERQRSRHPARQRLAGRGGEERGPPGPPPPPAA